MWNENKLIFQYFPKCKTKYEEVVTLAGVPQAGPWYKKEDYWAIIIALGLVLAMTAAFYAGATGIFKSMAVSVPSWSNDFSKVTTALTKNVSGIFLLFGFFLLVFTFAARYLGHNLAHFAAGFTVLYIISIIITIFGSNKFMKDWQLETPLLAL